METCERGEVVEVGEGERQRATARPHQASLAPGGASFRYPLPQGERNSGSAAPFQLVPDFAQ